MTRDEREADLDSCGMDLNFARACACETCEPIVKLADERDAALAEVETWKKIAEGRVATAANGAMEDAHFAHCQRVDAERERDAAVAELNTVSAALRVVTDEANAAIKRAEEAETELLRRLGQLIEATHRRANDLRERNAATKQRDRALALLVDWQSEGWSKELHQKTDALLAEVDAS